MAKITIELSGDDDSVLQFVGLCAKVELLGIWGASRTIPVDVDGDGSARLKFNIVVPVGKDKVETDLIDEWWKHNKEKFKEEVTSGRKPISTHYIGE